MADRFLHGLVPSILGALGSGGVLFLTWDEGTSDAGCCRLAGGGHVVTIVAGPGARRGFRSGTAYDTYSILRTIEALWGLRPIHHAACTCTRPMTSLLR